MIIKTGTNGDTSYSVTEGRNGQGSRVYHINTERTGSKGQLITHTETFTSLSEADSWVKYAL